MNLYDQLQALMVIPGAYRMWETYRQELTSYIIEQAYGKREIALFGVGRSNDIDLKLLSMYFEKIYLLDKDFKSMQEALDQYGLTDHPRIEMKVVDFVGIEDDELRDYADHLVREVRRRGMATDVRELAKAALQAISVLEEKMDETSLCFDTYENCVIMGVHSQLINRVEWIWHVILQTIQKEENSVREKIIEMNDKCVVKLNEALIKATKYHLIIGCEEARVGQVGMIQGAMQALDHIDRQIQGGKLQLLDETTMIWPFNEQETKVYRMKIRTCKC